MNHTTEEIENLLRHAPVPVPPPGLKSRLMAGLSTNQVASVRHPYSRPGSPYSWLRRWWPALAPVSLTLACGAILGMQELEIRDLKHIIHTLAPTAPPAEGAALDANPATPPPSLAELNGPEEIERLKSLSARLSDEVAQLEQVRSENTRLRAQLATPSNSRFTSEEEQVLEDARERGQRIQCCNNMKQLGLAVRVWSLDNTNMTPPDVISMSNEVSSLKVLICPADTGHQMAASWLSATPANCSYEYLAPNAPEDAEPNRVLFRCPIHGHVGLCDGSVQSGVAKSNPERLVRHDGKLYLQEAPATSITNSPPN